MEEDKDNEKSTEEIEADLMSATFNNSFFSRGGLISEIIGANLRSLRKVWFGRD